MKPYLCAVALAAAMMAFSAWDYYDGQKDVRITKQDSKTLQSIYALEEPRDSSGLEQTLYVLHLPEGTEREDNSK